MGDHDGKTAPNIVEVAAGASVALCLILAIHVDALDVVERDMLWPTADSRDVPDFPLVFNGNIRSGSWSCSVPSFDVVSEVDLHQLTNAVDQAGRIVANRFDFKGVDASFDRADYTVSLQAEADFQLEQMLDMLRGALIKCGIDPAAMEPEDAVASGKLVRQVILFKNGLDSAQCKKIVKQIKDSKLKVQAQIQGEQVRVTGKKRDDLQQVIAVLRDGDFGAPLQFNNFRD